MLLCKYFENCFLKKESNSDVLLIAFSCFDKFRNENNKFDYYYLTKQEEVDVLLVRDVNNTWYHQPIKEDQYGEKKLLDYIKKLSKRYRKIICIGSSMGAYGAIFFGIRIPADLIIAFSPQVTLDPKQLDKLKDFRHRSYIVKANNLCKYREFIDISKYSYEIKSKINVYFGQNDPADKSLFRILSKNKIYNILYLKYVNHGLANALRCSQILDKIIRSGVKNNELYNPSKELKKFRNKIRIKIKYCNILLVNNNIIKIKFHYKVTDVFLWNVKYKIKLLIKIINKDNNEEVLWKIFEVSNIENIGHFLKFNLELNFSSYAHGTYLIEIVPVLGKFLVSDIGFNNFCFFIRKKNDLENIEILDSSFYKKNYKKLIHKILFLIVVITTNKRKRMKFYRNPKIFFLEIKIKIFNILSKFY